MTRNDADREAPVPAVDKAPQVPTSRSYPDGAPALTPPLSAPQRETRVYCDGALTKALLAAKLDAGLVLTSVVCGGYSGGDVAYFRHGTAEEIADCRQRLAIKREPRAIKPPSHRDVGGQDCG